MSRTSFRVNPQSRVCLNVKELLARSRRHICGSLARKSMSLSNEPYMTRPFLIDLNNVELSYDPFLISLEKYSESCNSVDDLSTKMCTPN